MKTKADCEEGELLKSPFRGIEGETIQAVPVPHSLKAAREIERILPKRWSAEETGGGHKALHNVCVRGRTGSTEMAHRIPVYQVQPPLFPAADQKMSDAGGLIR